MIQFDFTGGMNLFGDSGKIAPNEYRLLINGRSRRNQISPIKMHVRDTGLPSATRIQGLYGAREWLLIFIDGKAYTRNISTSTEWVQVSGFQMTDVVDRIYAEAVDTSSLNFGRKTSGVDYNINDTISISGPIRRNPKCIVCQDAVLQPRIILPDGTARPTLEYIEWTLDNREYLEVGQMMCYHNKTLYVVAKDSDGAPTQILRSLRGRPLDMMVVIDENGDKLADPLDGSAYTVGHSVGYDDIVAVTSVSTDVSGAFFVGLKNASSLVLPTDDFTLFGEPTFANIPFLPIGPLNHFSLVDIRGDTAMITPDGLRTFNTVRQLNVAGNWSPFSLPVNTLFEGVIQTVGAATAFQNYAIFGMNTIYGPGMLVFDTLTQRFVALDIFPEIGLIKQFARVLDNTTERLFFITQNNRLYEAFAGATAVCKFYPRDVATDDPNVLVQLSQVKAVFQDVRESGTLDITPYADGKMNAAESKALTQNSIEESVPPVEIPTGISHQRKNVIVAADFLAAEQGWKAGALLTWECDASLSHVNIETLHHNQKSGVDQLVNTLGNDTITVDDEIVFGFTGDTGTDATIATAVRDLMLSWNPSFIILGGDVNMPSGAPATWDARFGNIYGALLESGRLFAVMGNHDIDYNLGETYLTRTRFPNNQRYYDKVFGSNLLHVLFVNSGRNTAETLVEADGIATGSQQWEWFKNRIAANSSSWRIAIQHAPVYTTGQHAPHTAARWDDRGLGIRARFAGHNHWYERIFNDYIPYITCGLGGSPRYSATTTDVNSVATYNENYGAVKVRVTRTAMELTMMSIDGVIQDSYVIRR